MSKMNLSRKEKRNAGSLAADSAAEEEQADCIEAENDWFFEQDNYDIDLSMDMEWDLETSFDDCSENELDCSVESGQEQADNLQDHLAHFPLRLRSWAIRSAVPREYMDELLSLLIDINIDVPKCTSTLLQTPVRAIQPRIMGPGESHYFGIENMLMKIDHPSLRDADEIILKIASDGVPKFKNSTQELIPMNGEIVGLKDIPLFPILIYRGNEKPSVNEYFEEFVVESGRLMREGVLVTSSKIRKPFSILNFGGDAPQRAWMRGVHGHTCKKGCHMCDQVGKSINRRVVYSSKRGASRTDFSFTMRLDPDHHQPQFLDTPTALEAAGFGMVSQFPVDAMHLIDLGVQRQILKLIRDNKCNVNTKAGLCKMESKMLEIYHYIPQAEFPRRPRSLNHVVRWKATEGRLFALYVGIVVLKDNVPDDLYYHFLHLTCAYRLISTSSAHINAETSNTLFERFVENFGTIYGEYRLTYNVHNLLHLCECVTQYGDVNEFSCYRNENYLQQIKKFVRKPSLVLQQISNRVEEIHKLNVKIAENGLFENMKPLFPGCPSYKGYSFDQFLLKPTRADAYCQIEPNIQFKIIGFAMQNDEEIVVGHRFLKAEPFFVAPMDSREVGIVICSELSAETESFCVERIKNKFINLPYEDKSVLVAILHHMK